MDVAGARAARSRPIRRAFRITPSELTDMPKAVLGAIVFLIGFDLIDILGLQRIYRRRVSEFVIAAVTAIVVFAVGVEQGIILAIALSILEIIRRQYNPRDFVIGVNKQDQATYQPEPGVYGIAEVSLDRSVSSA